MLFTLSEKVQLPMPLSCYYFSSLRADTANGFYLERQDQLAVDTTEAVKRHHEAVVTSILIVEVEVEGQLLPNRSQHLDIQELTNDQYKCCGSKCMTFESGS